MLLSETFARSKLPLWAAPRSEDVQVVQPALLKLHWPSQIAVMSIGRCISSRPRPGCSQATCSLKVRSGYARSRQFLPTP